MTRILTWNIGSTFSVQYAKYLGLVYKGQKIKHQYFQPILNGRFVSEEIKKVNPDVLFLQEIHDPADIQSISILKNYPYQKLFYPQELQYRDHQMFIASKRPFLEDRHEDTSIFEIDRFKYTPVHLEAFFPSKRLIVMEYIAHLCRDMKKVIVLGDTNLWQRKGWFMWSNDKKAYNTLGAILKDASISVLATSFTGFSPDKVFVSDDIKVKNITSPRIRGILMDHYPIFFTVE